MAIRIQNKLQQVARVIKSRVFSESSVIVKRSTVSKADRESSRPWNCWMQSQTENSTGRPHATVEQQQIGNGFQLNPRTDSLAFYSFLKTFPFSCGWAFHEEALYKACTH